MRKSVSLLVLFLLALSCTAIAQSQNGTIKGFVYDKKTGEPMIYTNVIVVGGKAGAQTDNNGYFSLVLPANSYTLRVSTLGYDSVILTVNLLPEAIVTKNVFLVSKETELKGVEVSGRKTAKLTHINTGVTTITPREIKLLPSSGGEPDVAQYLQVIPGVVFTGDQGGQLYIRGGSPAQTGIYLDGVTIYNPFHSIGLFSVFETEAIRNVDVYSAGFNAQYGNRTSAIVDVHTKDGNKNELAGIVSVSPIMSRILLEGPLLKQKHDNGTGITFLATAKSSYLDETSKSIYGGLGEPFKSGLPYKFTDLYAKVTFNFNNTSKLNLFAFNFDDQAKLNNDTSYIPTLDYHWKATGGGGTFVVSPGSSAALIDGKFSYSRYNIGLQQDAEVNPLDSTPRSSQIDGFEAAINFSYFLPNYSELRYGVEVSGIHTSLSYYSYPGVSTFEDRQSTLAGVYMIFRKNFDGKFIIEPSIRLQYYSELSKLSPEPRLGLKYNINNNVRLKASGGIYSQNIVTTKSDQDIVNLFTGFLLSPDQQIRNQNGQIVKSNLQTAYHAVGGIEVDIKQVELNFEPWYKYFGQIDELNRNKLYVSDPDFVAATGTAYGADLSAKYTNKRVYLWAALGYEDVTYTSLGPNNQVQTYPPPFDTRFNMNLLASYTAGKRNNWDFSVRYNMHAPFPFTQTQGIYEQLNVQQSGIGTPILPQNGNYGIIYANDINGGRLSYYYRVDVSIKRKFRLTTKSSIDATLAITNVTDRNNVFYVDRLTNKIDYQLPLFPSLNITWNF